ncbi:ATPase associated with various cellular activities AAA_3 [Halorhabdus utahensis DSM 12940]|uniref:ATPase associated with various cellular activities AAA_3 n=1 Tax=Halorhabdus utahensis (strain DSM 12940 / JCM 11049 / AX-2) TaxID=519442 RepID=C7NMN9_HALUD|nr:MoxR family ATPase [Halorhabdus utahensis]ACV11352.1 ATPase associated with various cellular activities AAA_3 [Halorhabdus utahensis DSM 12940]
MPSLDISDASARCTDVLDAMEGTVIADRTFLETVLTGVLARGHVLLEDVPGTGKTLTARSMAEALGLSFNRIQFTPDLLPADVTGSHIYNERERDFEFREGPIFANVVLADEINRAPPKTQAALLEAMSEGQVTTDGTTRDLPEPFFVIATQNPVESEGTFPLPEAQIDRFIVKTSIGYPDPDAEQTLLRRRTDRASKTPSVEAVLEPDRVTAIQTLPEDVTVTDDLIAYMTDIVGATRDQPQIRVGVSPRGTQRLLEAARARAVIEGREYVTPGDVKTIAPDVLAHRLVLTPDATVENVDKRDVLVDVLDSIPVPTVSDVDAPAPG